MPDETVQTKKHMCPVMIDREDYLWLKTKPRGYLTKLVRNAINEVKAKDIEILPIPPTLEVREDLNAKVD